VEFAQPYCTWSKIFQSTSKIQVRIVTTKYVIERNTIIIVIIIITHKMEL